MSPCYFVYDYIFVCLDDDDNDVKQTAALSGIPRGNTSSSPHSPLCSSQDLPSVKRRSHSFTSGAFAAIKQTKCLNTMCARRISSCFSHPLFPASVSLLCCLLSNLPEDQANCAKARSCGKRLQLLCDSGGWGQAVRQHICEPEL